MYTCISASFIHSQIAELSDMREEVMSRVHAAIDQAEVYCSSHASRSHLWTDDRHEFLRQFLKYGHVPTEEEIEAAGTCIYCTHITCCIWLHLSYIFNTFSSAL